MARLVLNNHNSSWYMPPQQFFVSNLSKRLLLSVYHEAVRLQLPRPQSGYCVLEPQEFSGTPRHLPILEEGLKHQLASHSSCTDRAYSTY